MKLLVVDDEKDIQHFVKRFFADKGFEVLTASDGMEALKIVEREGTMVVLLDVMMPGIDGIETLKRIKEKKPDTIVIMVSAVEDMTKINEAKIFGADGYITKPLLLDHLITRVRDAISKLPPQQ